MMAVTNEMKGAAALLGSEAKVRVLQALIAADSQRMADLTRSCGMSKSGVVNASRRLADAGIVSISKDEGEIVVSLVAEQRVVVDHIVSLDNVRPLIYPVSG